MHMVYGIISQEALAKLGITAETEPEAERYQALGERSDEAVETILEVEGGFRAMDTTQFNRNFRSMIYIPNERRELWVDARDLQQHSDHVSYTDAQYRDLLFQRGLEKLADHAAIEKVDSDIDPTANLVYEKDFDLGDLCTYRYSDVNIECSKRITEIQEVLEGSKRTLSVVFGNDSATDFKKIIRKET